MSVQCQTAGRLAADAPMSVFERYLTVWVLLCIIAGIALGQLMPGVFHAIAAMEIARVNLPVGLLIWVMIDRCPFHRGQGPLPCWRSGPDVQRIPHRTATGQ